MAVIDLLLILIADILGYVLLYTYYQNCCLLYLVYLIFLSLNIEAKVLKFIKNSGCVSSTIL